MTRNFVAIALVVAVALLSAFVSSANADVAAADNNNKDAAISPIEKHAARIAAAKAKATAEAAAAAAKQGSGAETLLWDDQCPSIVRFYNGSYINFSAWWDFQAWGSYYEQDLVYGQPSGGEWHNVTMSLCDPTMFYNANCPWWLNASNSFITVGASCDAFFNQLLWVQAYNGDNMTMLFNGTILNSTYLNGSWASAFAYVTLACGTTEEMVLQWFYTVEDYGWQWTYYFTASSRHFCARSDIAKQCEPFDFNGKKIKPADWDWRYDYLTMDDQVDQQFYGFELGVDVCQNNQITNAPSNYSSGSWWGPAGYILIFPNGGGLPFYATFDEIVKLEKYETIKTLIYTYSSSLWPGALFHLTIRCNSSVGGLQPSQSQLVTYANVNGVPTFRTAYDTPRLCADSSKCKPFQTPSGAWVDPDFFTHSQAFLKDEMTGKQVFTFVDVCNITAGLPFGWPVGYVVFDAQGVANLPPAFTVLESLQYIGIIKQLRASYAPSDSSPDRVNLAIKCGGDAALRFATRTIKAARNELGGITRTILMQTQALCQAMPEEQQQQQQQPRSVDDAPPKLAEAAKPLQGLAKN